MTITMTHIRYFILGIFAGLIFVTTSLFVQAQEVPVTLSLSQQASENHAQFHYPTIDDPFLADMQNPDGTLKIIPYMTIPFRKSDVQQYQLTEGWIYSDEELSIHHVDPMHGGVDFYVPYGTQVVAPVDGFVMASYQVTPLYNEEGERRTYQGKPISMGLGYFVYMYVPSVKRWVEIGHLASIDESIPFFPPTKEGEAWAPPTRALFLSDYLSNPRVKFIQKGHPIGTVGYSGLFSGDVEEYKEGMDRPLTLDQSQFESWDEPHVHYEEFWIHQETGEKGWQRDPYGKYSTFETYPTYQNPQPMGKDTLWLLDEYNYPQFAIE